MTAQASASEPVVGFVDEAMIAEHPPILVGIRAVVAVVPCPAIQKTMMTMVRILHAPHRPLRLPQDRTDAG